MSINAYLLEDHSRQISFQSDLKSRSLRGISWSPTRTTL